MDFPKEYLVWDDLLIIPIALERAWVCRMAFGKIIVFKFFDFYSVSLSYLIFNHIRILYTLLKDILYCLVPIFSFTPPIKKYILRSIGIIPPRPVISAHLLVGSLL